MDTTLLTMDQSSFPPVFDGHNDTILSLLFPAEGKERTFFERSEHGHLDLPRAREGGLGGGFFAMFTPSPRRAQNADAPPSEKPLLPEAPAQSDALNSTNRMLATLRTLVSRSDGEMQIVHNADELQKCMETGIFAVLLHIESAEAIDTDLHALHVLHAAGLRSIGPIWSRANAFATGVPFSFPATPDIGPGLTDAGKALVRECNTLGIMVDLSHMNEKGFWEVAQLSEAPLVATHSNAHTLAQSPRNLTDRQLDAVRESGGVVGVNFHIGN